MNLTPGTNQAQRDAIDRVLGKKITFGNFLPMMEIPRVSADDESFSETVIVYSESLDDHDFGYYDFKDNSWNVLGDFGMKMICWSYPEMPTKKDTEGFVSIETPEYKKERFRVCPNNCRAFDK